MWSVVLWLWSIIVISNCAINNGSCNNYSTLNHVYEIRTGPASASSTAVPWTTLTAPLARQDCVEETQTNMTMVLKCEMQ